MRCLACNNPQSDRDATRKSAIIPGYYYDLCGKCFDTIRDQVTPQENPFASKHILAEDERTEENEQDQDYSD